MKQSVRFAVSIAAPFILTLAAATATAQSYESGHGHGHGSGMGHGSASGNYVPMAGAVNHLTKQDSGSTADMSLVHGLLANSGQIKRTVTNLPNGIKTVTESDDPKVAQTIKAHVASMSQRLKDGREFNIFSPTLPVLFENRNKIQSTVDMTDKGTVVTRTSTDGKVVAALQGHAAEVTELALGGMPAFHRNMMSHMESRARGPNAQTAPAPTTQR